MQRETKQLLAAALIVGLVSGATFALFAHPPPVSRTATALDLPAPKPKPVVFPRPVVWPTEAAPEVVETAPRRRRSRRRIRSALRAPRVLTKSPTPTRPNELLDPWEAEGPFLP
ncbi:MAG: hypothetical protein AAGE52_40815 [Myxococcota bacterium]